MRFGSVCSGVEAASLAWEPLGWQAAWFAEIEAFPSKVLATRWPHVPNLGDLRALPALVRGGLVEAPDVLCGGTPCQAFSLAGDRRSLDDERGGLSLVFCDLAGAIDERRAGNECVIVWENVPGVLSTQDNAFGCFLAGLAGHGEPLEPAEPRPAAGRSSTLWRWDGKLDRHCARWSNAGYVSGPRREVCWRVLDAQWFGLAQRRRRVFVVASARNGFDPGRVLLEFEGVRRDSPPRRETREATASAAGRSVACNDVAGTLTASSGPNAHGFGDFLSNQAVSSGHLIVFGGNNTAGPIDVTPALLAQPGSGWKGDFEPETFVVFDPAQVTSATNRSNPRPGDPCHTLPAEPRGPIAVGFSVKDYGADATFELAPMLRAMGHADSRANGGGQVGVVQQWPVIVHADAVARTGSALTSSSDSSGRMRLRDAGMGVLQDGSCYSLTAASAPHVVQHGLSVRRLMPVECERLQGMPDGHTRLDDKTKDGPRYRAIGNSWAVPVVRWLGARLTLELSNVW